MGNGNQGFNGYEEDGISRFIIFGLVDPRTNKVRYVDKSRSGMRRAHASTRDLGDSIAKADWLRDLYLGCDCTCGSGYKAKKCHGSDGLCPDVALLEQFSDGRGLDDAKRRWIQKVTDVHGPVLNDPEPAIEAYLDVVNTENSSRNTPLYTAGWNPEKAWWLGVTFGDGHCEFSALRKRVVLTSEDYDLVAKWSALINGESRIRSCDFDGSYTVETARIDLAEWVAGFGMNGRKGDGLRWPESMSEEVIPHFVRGLWDTDGHVEWKWRTDRAVDSFRVNFTNKSKVLCDEVSSLMFGKDARFAKVYGTSPYVDNVYGSVESGGSASVRSLAMIYSDAPKHLRCERKYKIVSGYLAWRDLNTHECRHACGRSLVGNYNHECDPCRRNVYKNSVCTRCCESDRKVVANGLCGRCFQYQWNKKKTNRSSEYHESELKEITAGKEWETLNEAEREVFVEDLVNFYKTKEFPLSQVVGCSASDADHELWAVKKGSIAVDYDNGIVSNVGWSGQRLCKLTSPHRFKASYRNRISVEAAFSDVDCLRHALILQLRNGNSVTPDAVVRALSANEKGPSNFPPVLARWLVDTYAVDNGVVFDPCAGYGGRLLGSLASQRRVRYIGHDPELLTVDGNMKIAKFLGLEDRVEIMPYALEDDAQWPDSDLVMTCPPYYNCENYGEISTAIVNRYQGYEEWLSKFMGKLISRSMETSAILAMCVSSFVTGGKHRNKIDFPDDCDRLIRAMGLHIVKKWKWMTKNYGKRKEPRSETIFIVNKSGVK